MSQVYFFLATNNSPTTNNLWMNSLGSVGATFVTDVVTNGLSKKIGFAVGGISSAVAAAGVDFLEADVEISPVVGDPTKIKIGDNLYIIDSLTDELIAVAITTALVTALGVSAGGIIGLAIAGALAPAYSTFLDPITDSILLSLSGQDQLLIKDSAGNVIAGHVYSDVCGG